MLFISWFLRIVKSQYLGSYEILTIDANGALGIYVKVMHEGPWCSIAVDNAAMFDASTRETHGHD